MRAPLATLTLMSIACGPDPASRFEILRPPVIARCRPMLSATANPPPNGLFPSGAPMRVTLSVTARLVCEDQLDRRYERIDVEVLDERGGRAGREVTRSEGPGGARIELELQPPGGEGSLEVVVRAEPTLGRVVLPFGFVPLRTPSWERLDVSVCEWLMDLPDGRRGCAVQGAAPGLILLDGGVEKALPVSRAALLVGRDLWLLLTTPLQTAAVLHFLDDGGITEDAIDAGFVATAIAARDDRVVLGGLTRDRQVVLEEFSPRGSVRVSSTADGGSLVGPGAMLFLNDDELLVVRTASRIERWPTPSRSDGGLSLPPLVLDRGPLSVTREGIWLTDGSSLTLLRPDAGTATLRTMLAFQGSSANLIPFAQRVPFDVVVLPVDTGAATLGLDYVRLPPGLRLGAVTPEWIYASEPLGMLHRTPRQQ